MSKRIGLVVALAGIGALSLFLLNCGSSSSRPSGLLYVLTQGINGTGNNISSFAIDLGSGNLSLINSNLSTCASGATCGLPVDILLDPTGAVAFVLSQNAISAFKVNSDGSLGAPTTAWTAPAGDTAIAMTRDAAGQFLFVLDTGSNPLGTMCPLPGTLDPGNPIYTGCPSLWVFSMQPGSTSLTIVSQFLGVQGPLYLGKAPTALSALTFPAPGNGTTPACGFGTSEEFLYVTSNHDLTPQHNDNALSLYCVSSTGNLTDMTPNPPYTPQVDPLSVKAVNTNPAGKNTGGVFVYVGSQPSSSGALSIFQLCTVVGNAGCTQTDVTNALLLPVGTSPPATGQNPIAMVVDPTNNFLYVVCYGSNQVFGYRINTSSGALAGVSPVSEPTGLQPVALALHPSVGNTGQFLYTSNSNSSNITGLTLSTTSGSMSNPITVVAPAAPSGMTAR
jgi:hypothetical protein